MKENKIVKLVNITNDYQKLNLYDNVYGIVLKYYQDYSLVLFLNGKILGDYAVVKTFNSDIQFCDDLSLPNELILELRNEMNKKINLQKGTFKNLEFSEYDLVELLVEDEKYSKYGVHKGDRGVVAIDYSISNTLLVDFTDVLPTGEFYGDCISVDINDLKLIAKNEKTE